jgi:hypothetical protein
VYFCFLDYNGKKKFLASAIADIRFFTKFSANCCKKKEKAMKTQVDQGDYKQIKSIIVEKVQCNGLQCSVRQLNGFLCILTRCNDMPKTASRR